MATGLGGLVVAQRARIAGLILEGVEMSKKYCWPIIFTT